MKNLIDEKPTDALYGRTRFTFEFVSNNDIDSKHILDIGCGFGWFEFNAISRGAAKIIGIEPSEQDLSSARKYTDNQKIEFKAGGATDLPFKDASFDTVVAWEVLEHIPKNTENTMFREVCRVLKDDGVFYLSTPNNSFFSVLFDPAYWLIGHRHYSKERIIHFSSNNGLYLDNYVINGGWWEIFSINNLLVSKWIFRRRPFMNSFVATMVDREYSQKNGFTNIFMKFRKKSNK